MSDSEDTKPSDMKESLISRTEIPNEPKPYEPKKIFGLDGNLVALSIMNFFLNAAVSVITPFYPPTALDKGVSQFMIGLIFALNPIGSFSVSLQIGQMMGKLGKKNLMFWGLLIQSFTIITFGLVWYIDNEGAFIAISMVARFLQGASRSAYGAATFGYVPQLWPTTVQKKIGIMETMTAIGLVLGPMIGTLIYNIASSSSKALAYQLPFYTLSTVFILCIYTIKWLPPDVKNKVELDKVLAVDCFKNQGIFWTFALMVASAVANVYINPQYTVHMKDLGIGEDASGYLVSVGAFFYMVFLHLMPAISKKLDKKFILMIGTIISVFAVLVQAPEQYLGFPLGGSYWYFVTMGQCINGIGSAMVILPMIPELIELIVVNEMKSRKIAQPNPKLIRACSDMGSSIFVGGYALGTFIGPFGGSLLYQFLPGDGVRNFMNESRILAFLVCIILALYMTIGKGYLGIQPTLKKLNICQKRQQAQNSEAVLQQRAANKQQDSRDSNSRDSISNSSSAIHVPETIIDGRAIQSYPIGDKKSKSHVASEVSDELLSDYSPIDVLSDGDEEKRDPLKANNPKAENNAKGDKDTLYFD